MHYSMIWTRNGYVVWTVQLKSKHQIVFSLELILQALNLLTSDYKSIMLMSMNGLQTIPPLSKFKQISCPLSGRPSLLNKFRIADKPFCHLLEWRHVARSCRWTLTLDKEKDLGEFLLENHPLGTQFVAKFFPLSFVWNVLFWYECHFGWMYMRLYLHMLTTSMVSISDSDGDRIPIMPYQGF